MDYETTVTRSYGEKDRPELAALPGLFIELKPVFDE